MYISMMTFLCNRIDFHLIVVISCNFHLRIVAMLIPVRWPSHSMKNHLQKGVYAMFMYIHIYILCVQYQIFTKYTYIITYHVCIYTYTYEYICEYIYKYIYITVFVPNSASMICPRGRWIPAVCWLFERSIAAWRSHGDEGFEWGIPVVTIGFKTEVVFGCFGDHILGNLQIKEVEEVEGC